MINEKFFMRNKILTIKEICEIISAQLPKKCDPTKEILAITTLDEASKDSISFFHNAKYSASLKDTKAYACIIAEKYKSQLPENVVPLVVAQPYLALAKLLSEFYAIKKMPIAPYIAKTARISKSAKIGENCYISDFTIIEDDAVIEDGTFIGPNSTILAGVQIGEGSHIESNVTIGFSTIGKFAYIKTGARIGQQGFGFYAGKEGIFDIMQLGTVVIGNNVQIGANCTIDRGSLGDTKIGDFARIDNMVHIAHNVEIGAFSIIAAQTGIAGSTKIGSGCVFGGQVGIAGHLNVGNNVMIAAQSGVMKNVENNGKIAGSPAQNIIAWQRQNVLLKKLLELRQSPTHGILNKIKSLFS